MASKKANPSKDRKPLKTVKKGNQKVSKDAKKTIPAKKPPAKPPKGKKTTPEGLVSDKELKRIQKELQQSMGKSILIEEDLKKLQARLSAGVCRPKNLTGIPPTEHKITCPKCNTRHTIHVTPHAGGYRVKTQPAPKNRKSG